MVELPAYLRDVKGGCALTVKVHPSARRARLVGPHGDALKVEVMAAPAGGAANAAVEALVAGVLKIARNRVVVSQGASARRKVVVVDGLTAAAAAALLVAPDR